MNSAKDTSKPVYVFDLNEKLVAQYESAFECFVSEHITVNNIGIYSKRRKTYNGKYYSYSEILKPDTSIF